MADGRLLPLAVSTAMSSSEQQEAPEVTFLSIETAEERLPLSVRESTTAGSVCEPPYV